MLDNIENKIGEVCVAGTTLSIIENTALMNAFNASISALYKDVNGNYRIIVDSSYHSRPEYVKDFFIQHEVGHYIHGDLQCSDEEANARHFARLQGELHVSELLADEYAASQLSKTDVFRVSVYFNSLVTRCNKVINRMEKTGELTPEQVIQERNSVNEFKYRSKLLAKNVGKRFIDELFRREVI